MPFQSFSFILAQTLQGVVKDDTLRRVMGQFFNTSPIFEPFQTLHNEYCYATNYLYKLQLITTNRT